MKIENKAILLSLLCGILVWVIDALLDYFIFYEGTFWGLMFLDVPSHEVYIRIVALFSFLAFGFLVSRILKKRRKAEERLKTLFELGKKVSSMTLQKELLPWIAEQAATLLDTEVCTYRIREGDDLVSGGGTGGGIELMKKETLKIGESISGWIAKEKKPLIIDDLTQDKRHIEEHNKIAKKLGFIAFLGVPMMIGDEAIGVLNVHTKRTRKFTEDDIQILSSFADHAAIALKNARLFRDREQEIKERERAEELVKLSLKEKELLLQEVHHRVKNNMQVISSILTLQSATLNDNKIKEVFKECNDRIRSMAIVHEKLYSTKEISRIDFKEYTETIVGGLLASYKKETQEITFKIDVRDVFLDIGTAIPVGLILNELVTNSLKHAFPEREKGKIQITFHNIGEEKIELKVKDNGIGLPDGFDLKNTNSLGLNIISLLKDQLNGEMEFRVNKGTEFQININRAKHIKGT